jgi:hemerythrin
LFQRILKAHAMTAETATPIATIAPAAASPAKALPEQLRTGHAQMDETHEEFMSQLHTLLATPMRDQLPLYKTFLAHTIDHFAQEEQWMLATGFTPDNCHAKHHALILETMNAVESHYLDGDNAILQRLCEALQEWFAQHATTMDAGLAQHLQEVGFDAQTHACTQDVVQGVHSSCGSAEPCPSSQTTDDGGSACSSSL